MRHQKKPIITACAIFQRSKTTESRLRESIKHNLIRSLQRLPQVKLIFFQEVATSQQVLFSPLILISSRRPPTPARLYSYPHRETEIRGVSSSEVFRLQPSRGHSRLMQSKKSKKMKKKKQLRILIEQQ